MPDLGAVKCDGNTTVRPDATTTYTLTARGPGGEASASVQITVRERSHDFEDDSFAAANVELIPLEVDPSTYEEERFAVLRGEVLGAADEPLSGVAISVHGQAALGGTETDALGRYALPVNGGGVVTIVFEKDGFISAQRTASVPWGSFVVLDVVQLLQRDTAETAIELDGDRGSVFSHTSSEVTDAAGSRAATVVIKGDNRVFAVDEHGDDMAELGSITIRATEYQTKESMPAALPPSSAYTYCVELEVEEAERVRFEQPVFLWVDNFLGFDVGTPVPVGYYDRDRAVWVPSDDGLVVRLVDADNDGVVDGLDADDDDFRAPDDLDGDGDVSDEIEGLENLARYQPGDTLWRAEITHFTPWDCNWPYGPPPGARAPSPPDAASGDTHANNSGNGCEETGSFVTREQRDVHETIAVPGSALMLHYSSGLARPAAPQVELMVSDEDPPGPLLRVQSKLNILGRQFVESFGPLPNQRMEVGWDGFDLLGRQRHGSFKGQYQVDYVYDAYYYEPGDFPQSFAQAGQEVTANRARQEITMTLRGAIDVVHAPPTAVLGRGWSVERYHRLLSGGLLLRGDGSSGIAADQDGKVIESVAGQGDILPSPGALIDADEARIISGRLRLDIDARGNVYFSDDSHSMVFKVDRHARLSVVAGNGLRAETEVGAAATATSFHAPADVAIDDADNLYIADRIQHTIFKVNAQGRVERFAGSGERGFAGDGEPATQAMLSGPEAVTTDGRGNVYIVDAGNRRVRKVDPTGAITTVAGSGGYYSSSVDNVNALEVDLGQLHGALAVDDDGNLFFSSSYHVHRVDPTGMLSTIAGGGSVRDLPSVGVIPARGVQLQQPLGLAVSALGEVYVVDARSGGGLVLRVNKSGLIGIVAGPGGALHENVEGSLATEFYLRSPRGISVHPDGSLYIGVSDGLLRARRPMLGGGIRLDAREQYYVDRAEVAHIFDADGLHLRTVDLKSGRSLLTFDHDAAGRLVAVEDRLGRVTTIERDARGAATSVVGPHGHRTELEVDDAGDLTQIRFEDDASYQFSYTDDGLLAATTDPLGRVSTHSFDEQGKVVATEDAHGAAWSFSSRRRGAGELLLSSTSALGNVTSNMLTVSDDGAYHALHTTPSGATHSTSHWAEGQHRQGSYCGMTLDARYTTDIKSASQTLKQLTLRAPSGLSYQLSVDKEYSLAPDGAPLVANSTWELNGLVTHVNEQLQQAQTMAYTPEGRVMAINRSAATGQPVQVSTYDLEPRSFEYNAAGQLTALFQGDRSESYTYDERGALASVTDIMGRTTEYSHDAVGRVTQVRQPGDRVIGLAHDAMGNLARLTLPGGAHYSMIYGDLDAAAQVTTPHQRVTSLSYDLERRLVSATHPSQRTVSFGYTYDRLTRIDTPEGDITLDYACDQLVGSMNRGDERVEMTYDGVVPTRIQLRGSLEQTVELEYGAGFELSGLSYAGETSALTRDQDGLPVALGRYLIDRDEVNGLTSSISDGDLEITRTYNSYGEVAQTRYRVGGAEVFSVQLTRAPGGDVRARSISVSGAVTSEVFSYDPLGQLIEVSRDGSPSESYAYDHDGDRSSYASPLRGVLSRQVLVSPDGLSVTAGEVVYGFNHDGQLSQSTEGALVTRYQYSSLGELQRVTLPDQVVISFVHDPLGRRIAKLRDGVVEEKYLWLDKTTLLAVFGADDNLRARFEYADERLPVSMTLADGTRYYFAYDQVGAPRALIDVTGAVVRAMDYDAFGNLIEDTNPELWQPFGFAGGLFDVDAGLVRFGYRDYIPELGRWAAPDPIWFGGGDFNLHGYVFNDPVNAVDPNGLWAISLEAYKILGGSFSFGRDNGHWFVMVGAGFGVGAGISFDFTGGFPGGRDGNLCGGDQWFLGSGGTIGMKGGPLTLGVSSSAGLLVGNDAGGNIAIDAAGSNGGTIAGTFKGGGLGLVAGVDIARIGYMW